MRTPNRLLLAGLFAFCPLIAIAADDAPSADPDVTIRTRVCKNIPINPCYDFRESHRKGRP